VNCRQDYRKNDGYKVFGKAITYNTVVDGASEIPAALNAYEGKTNSMRLP
jgi:hypothetical protein